MLASFIDISGVSDAAGRWPIVADGGTDGGPLSGS
jgi:hypothetical protein